jgi:hypothetical protein
MKQSGAAVLPGQAGPKSGDVVIWSLDGAVETATSYLVFKIGDHAAPHHYEGPHIWGKVFTAARQYAHQQAIWLREGIGQPRRLAGITTAPTGGISSDS